MMIVGKGEEEDRANRLVNAAIRTLGSQNDAAREDALAVPQRHFTARRKVNHHVHKRIVGSVPGSFGEAAGGAVRALPLNAMGMRTTAAITLGKRCSKHLRVRRIPVRESRHPVKLRL